MRNSLKKAIEPLKIDFGCTIKRFKRIGDGKMERRTIEIRGRKGGKLQIEKSSRLGWSGLFLLLWLSFLRDCAFRIYFRFFEFGFIHSNVFEGHKEV